MVLPYVSTARSRYFHSPFTFMYVSSIRQLTQTGRLRPVEGLFSLEARLDYPAIDGRVIHRDPTFEHECFDMPRAQGVGHIPADACQNDLFGEVGPAEAHGHRLSLFLP
jgi:hypothetical protein